MALTIPFNAGTQPAQLNNFLKPALWLATISLACYSAATLYADSKILLNTQNTTATQKSQRNNTPTVMPASQIAALHLLGKLGESSTPTQPAKDLPQTRLQLELKGAFTNTQADQASALIAAKGKSSKRYFVSDSLPGGAKLHSVAADSVTLDRGGNLEILRFPKAKSSGSSRTSTRGRPTSSRSSNNGPVHGNTNPASRYSSGARHNSRMR